jgi:hybrid cluster-associated redox disulfide protein
MRRTGLSDLAVADIMTQWPETIGTFIAFKLHCVGCPIAAFHTLTDAADEHGTRLNELTAAVANAMEISETAGGLGRGRRR